MSRRSCGLAALLVALSGCPSERPAADAGAPDALSADGGGDGGGGTAARVCSVGGWCWENPLPQGDTVFDMWGTSPRSVWAVGANGIVLHFDGERWQPRASGVRDDLYAVHGSSDEHVVAVGARGTVVRFDGKVWRTVSSPTPSDLRAVWSTAAGEMMVAGDDGVIARYLDGGWNTRSTDPRHHIVDMWGHAGNDLYAVGSDETCADRAEVGCGLVLHFDGSDWSRLDAPINTPLLGVWGVAADRVYALTRDRVWRYNGVVWTEIPHGQSDPLSIWAAGPNAIYVGSQTFAFPTYAGQIHRYDGERWTPLLPVVLPFVVQQVAIPPIRALWGQGTRVFCGGDIGALARIDGDKLTTDATTITSAILTGTWGAGPDDIWAVGADGVVLRWQGAASGWKHVSTGYDVTWRAVTGRSADDVWLLASGGSTIAHYDGASFSVESSGTALALSAIWVSADGVVFAVGQNGAIVRRADSAGFKPMISGTDLALAAVWGDSATSVWAAGLRGTMLHFDGTSWSAVDTKTTLDLTALWGSGANNVIAAAGGGSTMLHYDGQSWLKRSSGTTTPMRALYGIAPDNVIAVGDSGAAIHFDGTRWTPQETGMRSRLWGVWIAPSTEAVAVGESGVIIRRPASAAP